MGDYCYGSKPAPPPIGLRPRWIACRERMAEILDAMKRYSQASMKIPSEWIEELDELNDVAQRSKDRDGKAS